MRIEGKVPTVESPTKTEFTRDFLEPQRPVVLRGVTKHWKAHSAWTLDYLRAKIATKRIQVKESPSNVHPDFFSGAPSRVIDSDLGEYIDLVASDRPQRAHRYLSGDEIRILHDYTSFDPVLAALREDIAPPEYCDERQIKTIGFWLSAQGVVASLHYDHDGCHNLNAQVKGRKRVLLFAPNQALYPFSGTHPARGSHNFSQVNILQPDEQRFPGFRSARCLEAIIEEGDMLFIPSFWYHAVFHLGDVNINVNFWWQPEHIVLSKTSFRSTFLALLDDAVVNGTSRADEAQRKSAYANLSPETRDLLAKMESLISRQYRM